jgi:hypothetical protein
MNAPKMGVKPIKNVEKDGKRFARYYVVYTILCILASFSLLTDSSRSMAADMASHAVRTIYGRLTSTKGSDSTVGHM